MGVGGRWGADRYLKHKDNSGIRVPDILVSRQGRANSFDLLLYCAVLGTSQLGCSLTIDNTSCNARHCKDSRIETLLTSIPM